MLKVIDTHDSLQYSSLIRVDGYVPIKFHTQSDPLGGARHIRLGNFKNSLLEVTVPFDSMVIRGVSVTLVPVIGKEIMTGTGGCSNGLPILELPKDMVFSGPDLSQRVDMNCDFSLSVSDNVAEVRFGDVKVFDFYIIHQDVLFLILKNELVGIRFVNLTSDSISNLLSRCSK